MFPYEVRIFAYKFAVILVVSFVLHGIMNMFVVYVKLLFELHSISYMLADYPMLTSVPSGVLWCHFQPHRVHMFWYWFAVFSVLDFAPASGTSSS